MTGGGYEHIQTQYASEIARYDAFRECLQRLLPTILRERDLRVRYIVSRVKTLESILLKLTRSFHPSHSLGQVADIVGVRIVSYFDTDAREIIECVRSEFTVVSLIAPSRDGDPSSDAAETGYHVVIRLSPKLASLPEYRLFAGLQAEIQVRSLVQQALDDIAHELVYRRDPATERMWRRFLALGEILDTTVGQLRSDILARNLSVTEVLADIKAMTPPTEREKDLTREKAESLVRDFGNRLRASKREEELQTYLSDHPELLYPDFIECHAKFPLGENYVTDYVLLVQGHQGLEYVFVEIERPDKEIFTKSGQFAEPFTQAKNQLLDWENWLTKNHGYISRKLPRLYKPQFHLVMGRDSKLTTEQKEKLHSEFLGTVRRFSTYDDIETRFERIIARLFGA